jgi:hypothetical protein
VIGAMLVGMTRRRAAFGREEGGMRRDAAPADDAGHAEGIECARIVVGDALREEGSLPLDGRGFEAFELAERVEHALFAGELRLRREVLPSEEPMHVLRGGDGFDLFAQRMDGALVDALEEAALTPLDLMIALRCGWNSRFLHFASLRSG